MVNIQQAIKTVNGKKVSLWEDKFSLERLEAILKQSGKIIFNMQYQNDTELAKGRIFKAKYFKYYEEYKLDYDFQTAKIRIKNAEGVDVWKKVRVYMGADLAISEEENSKNDYFVLMMIGVDEDRNVYVLEYVKERLTFNSQLNTTISYGRDKYPMVERIGVETNQYQKALAQELRRLSLLPVININTSKAGAINRHSSHCSAVKNPRRARSQAFINCSLFIISPPILQSPLYHRILYQ